MIFKLCNNGLSVVGTREDSATVSYSIEAEEYKQWLLEGNTPEPEFTDEELLAQFKASIVSAVQTHLDSQAQSKGYDSILSATSYAGYPNDFQAEGIAFGTWRANVWKYCYTQLAEIESGERPTIPTVEEFIAELPLIGA